MSLSPKRTSVAAIEYLETLRDCGCNRAGHLDAGIDEAISGLGGARPEPPLAARDATIELLEEDVAELRAQLATARAETWEAALAVVAERRALYARMAEKRLDDILPQWSPGDVYQHTAEAHDYLEAALRAKAREARG